jgi:glyoxylase-like metal-dependent hydrolase (beta-lactamase superfamily II)
MARVGCVSAWTEVADGVFHRRYDPLDISVCVVRGSRGLLVVDTRSSHREADEIRADLTELGGSPVRWVVNTHAHYDHTFGNFRFGPDSDVGAPIYGHERIPAHLDAYERPMLARRIETGQEPVDDWREIVITPPTVLVADHLELDLGDHAVSLLHLGRGHTDNDLVVHVPDADAWLAGDLVEESGPPMYGSGSFPLDWPNTAAALAERVSASAVVVPGHGAPVGRSYVSAQAADLATVAATIRALHAAGVTVSDAVAAGRGRWPFPEEGLQSAVKDAYGQLGRVAAGGPYARRST